MIYVTLFNPAIDLYISTEQLILGDTFTGLESEQVPAGKGINVAKVVKALGEEVSVIGVMPAANRFLFSTYLERLGIGAHFFDVPGKVRTNVTLLEHAKGRVTHLNAKSEIDSHLWEHVLEFVFSFIGKTDLFCLSGSLPSGASKSTYYTLITLLSKTPKIEECTC